MHWLENRLPSSERSLAWYRLTRLQMVRPSTLLFCLCIIYNLDLNNWASCCNSICFVSVYKFVLYIGFITLEEMATIVQSLDRRPTIEEIRDMICEVYIDGNGTLDFEEFLNVMGRKQKVNNNMKWISIGAFICKCLLFSLWDYRQG